MDLIGCEWNGRKASGSFIMSWLRAGDYSWLSSDKTFSVSLSKYKCFAQFSMMMLIHTLNAHEKIYPFDDDFHRIDIKPN